MKVKTVSTENAWWSAAAATAGKTVVDRGVSAAVRGRALGGVVMAPSDGER